MEKDIAKRPRGFKIFILILLLLIVFFSNEDIRLKFEDLIRKIGGNSKTLVLKDSFPIKINTENMKLYENMLIRWEEGSIIAVRIDGNKGWEKKSDFQEPLVSFGKNNIYFSEGSTGDIYYLSKEGKSIKRVEMKSQISRMFEKNNALIIAQNNDAGGKLSILDGNGKLIASSIFEDGYFLDLNVDDKKTKYGISTLNLDEDNMNSTFVLYEMNGKEINRYKFNDEILIFTQFVNNDNLILLTDSKIYFLKSNNIIWEKGMNKIKNIYVQDKNIYLLYDDTLEIINFEGKTEEKISLKEEYNKIIFFNDKYFLLFGDTYISGFSKEGKEVLKYKTDGEIKNVFANGKEVVVIFPEKIEIMEISNK